MKQRRKTVAIDGRGCTRARELDEGRIQIDVLGDLLNGHVGRNSRSCNDEWNADVAVERGLFPGHQPVLAHVVAVVGGEEDEGVGQQRNTVYAETGPSSPYRGKQV